VVADENISSTAPDEVDLVLGVIVPTGNVAGKIMELTTKALLRVRDYSF
jgi:hypothetical protein